MGRHVGQLVQQTQLGKGLPGTLLVGRRVTAWNGWNVPGETAEAWEVGRNVEEGGIYSADKDKGKKGKSEVLSSVHWEGHSSEN